jgi:hypothetical protein
MLKIAAADKSWLQQLVLTERRRLAGLHRSAITTANTDTAIQDHEGDAGYAAALADKREAPKATPKTGASKKGFHPDDMGVENSDIENFNLAVEHFEEENQDPVKVFQTLNQLMRPGMNYEELVQTATPMLRVAASKKADQSPNDPSGWAVESHEEGEKEGEKAYETALDPKVGSRKRSAELKAEDSGSPPNTSRATEDHAFELKALAQQIQSMTAGSTDWDPNDPLLD